MSSLLKICAYTAVRLFNLAGSITDKSFAHIMDGSTVGTDYVNTFLPYRRTEQYLLKRGWVSTMQPKNMA